MNRPVAAAPAKAAVCAGKAVLPSFVARAVILRSVFDAGHDAGRLGIDDPRPPGLLRDELLRAVFVNDAWIEFGKKLVDIVREPAALTSTSLGYVYSCGAERTVTSRSVDDELPPRVPSRAGLIAVLSQMEALHTLAEWIKLSESAGAAYKRLTALSPPLPPPTLFGRDMRAAVRFRAGGGGNGR